MRLGIYVVLLLSFCYAPGQQAKLPVLTLPEITHDFGYIKQNGGAVKHRFIVQNNSDSMFMITNVRSTCNCTAPFWTQTPIEPGKDGYVDIEFDPKDYEGAFHKTIQVLSTASNTNMFLTISGKVLPPIKEEELRFTISNLKVQRKNINLGYLYKGTSREKRITVYNSGNSPMEISFSNVPEYISLTTIPQVIEPNEFGQIELNYCTDKTEEWYIVTDEVDVAINGNRVDDGKLRITANIREDFTKLSKEELLMAPIVSYDKDSVKFGEINDKNVLECSFLITNRGKSDLSIRAIRPSCGCTVAQPDKQVLAPGESTYVHANFDPENRKGKVTNSITIITNDPNQYKKDLYIEAIIDTPKP